MGIKYSEVKYIDDYLELSKKMNLHIVGMSLWIDLTIVNEVL